MKLVYLGSPEAAVVPLEALVGAGHHIVLVVSQADKRRGRGSGLSPSPVKAAALRLGLPVSDRPDDVLEAVAGGAELGVVVAYGRLIKPHLLDVLPFVNLHFSLLPRWRGAAPVERALLAGDTETGVCLMGLEAGLDTGPVFRVVRTPINGDDTAASLRERLVSLGTVMLVDGLRDGFRSLGVATPQSGEPTYAAKIDPAELELDWARDAVELERLVRMGGAWTTFRGARLKIISARVVDDMPIARGSPGSIVGLVVTCGRARLELVRVQPEGKTVVDAVAWRNGARPVDGEQLGV